MRRPAFPIGGAEVSWGLMRTTFKTITSLGVLCAVILVLCKAILLKKRLRDMVQFSIYWSISLQHFTILTSCDLWIQAAKITFAVTAR